MPRLKPIAVFITMLFMLAAVVAAGLAALPSSGAGAEGGTLNNSSITGLGIAPQLNITRFDFYTLSVNVSPGGRTINNVSFVIRPQNAGVNNSNWDFLTNGTPNPDPNVPFTRAATNTGGDTWSFSQLRPNNIYPEIAFIRGINSSPSNSRFWRDSYHLMHFTNQFDMGINTSFFIELYATPKTSPPLSVDMQVFLVGNGFDISAFQSGVFADEAWRNHADVELVGTISQASDYHHTHSPNSSHFLIPLSTNSEAKIEIGNKSIDISGDFWVILTTGHQLQNRGWDLKYHAGENNGTWYKGSGTTFALQSGCPDAHVHFARELPAEEYNGMEVYVTVGYTENGSPYNFSSASQLFYFNELPKLPPNPSAFTAPAPGIYQGDVTISWLPATDPNNDPLTYDVYLINESATEQKIADRTSNTSLVLNTSAYDDGFYNIRVEACDNEFCTPFNLLANFDEGLCEFFRIWNGDPEDGGIGTTGNPYLICDVCDLQNMKLNLSAHYALNNSIDLTGFDWGNWSDGNGFIPVGSDSTPFTGSLNGSGYTITGLFINRSATDLVGLFGYLGTGASVGNVSLIDADITGQNQVGGLTGRSWSGSAVSNSSVSGNVSGINYVGGLAGYNNGSVSSSYAAGGVSGTVNGNDVGGLAGYNNGSVSDSYATGNVSGKDYIGGLVGGNYGNVSNSYSMGNVSGSYVGGLVGVNSGNVSNSFYDQTTSGRSDNDGRGVPKTTAEMKTLSTFTGAGWDIERNSEHNINDGYPYLSWQVPGNSPVWYIYSASYTLNISSTAGGDVSTPGEAGPYVYNSSEVVNIVATPDSCYNFVNWTGDVTTVADVNASSTTITMNNSYTIQANFAITTYNLTTSSTAGGDVTTPGEAGPYTYNCSQIVNISATADACYQFVNWSGTGVDAGKVADANAASTTINMSNNYSVQANFAIEQYTLTYSSGAGGFVAGATPQTIDCGSDGSEVTAYAENCYYFVNWSDASTDNPRTDTSVTGNITVTANFAANSSYSGGSGTAGDPYLICDACDLQAMNLNLSAHYALNNDINASATEDWNNSSGFTPVGDESNPFTGSFNGSGHTITGLFISLWNTDYVGLFGYVDTAVSIGNVSLADLDITANNNLGVGGLAGYNDGSVYNCSATGEVNGDQTLGGLIGFNGENGTVNCSYAAVYVVGDQVAGGLAGENQGLILRSYAAGNVTATNSNIGGLVGYNSQGYIYDTYATGNVNGANDVGGLVGTDNGGGTINSSYSTGYVSGTGSYIGGFLGKNEGIKPFSDSFWDTETSNQSISAGGTGKTTAEMKTLSTFNGSGWDIEENTVNINNGYPYLSWQTPGNSPVWYIYPGPFSFTLNYSAGAGGTLTGNTSQTVDYGGSGTAVTAVPDECYHFVSWNDSSTDNPRTDTNVTSNITVTANFAAGYAYANGSGTIGDPWLITNVDELQGMICNLSAHYALANDINASETSAWNSGAGFIPVGNGSGTFTGSFDGRGYTVTGLFINRSAEQQIGLFGYVNTGSAVSNVSLAGVNISGLSLVGGLAGISYGSVFNCSAAGNVSGTESVGGLMGYNMGTVSNSSAAANVSGTYMITGGLVGWNDAINGYGSISNSSAAGNVTGVDSVGGLTGINQGSVYNSSATANVNGNDDVGGLVGANYGSVDHSSAAGNVNGTGTKIGGLAGFNYEADISDSGASGDVSGPAGSYSYCGGLVGYDIRGNISNSSAAGNVSGGDINGGLIAYSTGGNVSGSSATGNLSGNNFAGGLIGYIENGTVINCPAAVRVNSSGQEIGGLIGDSLTVTVLNCSASGNVSGTHYAGGLIGANANSSVSGSYATGNVSITGNCAGGLIGFNNQGSTVSNTSASGNVSGTGTLGGLIGQNLDSAVSDSYATGAVNGNQAGVGGLMGQNYGGTVYNCSASGDVNTGNISWNSYAGGLAGSNDDAVDNCSATGNVNATGDYVGGLIGQNITGGSVSNSSAAGGVSGNDFVGGLAGYSNGSISDSHAAGVVSGTGFIGGLVGHSEEGGPVAGCWAAGNVSGSVNVGGLTGYSQSTVSNSHAAGNVSGSNLYAGGLIGQNNEGTVNNSYATGNVSVGHAYAGGLMGYSNAGAVANSYATGDVTSPLNLGDYLGGLVGDCDDGSIMSSYAAGNVGGDEFVGGLVGHTNLSDIFNSYAMGNVTGQVCTGGLIGQNYLGTVNKSYAAGGVSWWGAPNWIGGLVGDTFGDPDSLVTNSFWDIQTSGRATSDGGTGKNTSEMKDFFTFYDTEWDLICESTNGDDDIWGLDYSGADNNGYPFLWWQGLTHNVSFTLTYTAGPNGTINGTSPQVVGCNGSGSAVQAVPDNCYVFVNWSDSNIANPRTDTNVFGNITVTANFATDTFMLNTSSTVGGNVSPPGEGSFGPYNCSQIVPITAVNDSCYYFVNWSGTGVDAGMVAAPGNASTTINMSHSYSVQANFAIYQYTLNYSAGANGSIAANASQTVNCSADGLPVTAVPDACYHFVNWSDAETDNPRTDTNVLGNIAATANFAIDKVALTTSSTAGGNVTAPGEAGPYGYDCGDIVTINATPDACYHFVNWTGTGVDANRVDDPSAASTTINMTGSYAVHANFAIDQFTLTYNAGPNGTITGTTPQTVNCGADGAQVTAVPDACYHFVNWSDSVTTAARTDTNVLGDITVTANFAIDTFTLTYTAGTGGTINGTSPQTVNCGADGTGVTAVPDAGFNFFQWSDGEANASRTDTNVLGDITVTANFRRPGGGGGYSPPSVLELNIDIFDHTIMALTDGGGTVQGDVYAISPDGNVSIHIPAGTTALFGNGSPLTELNVDPIDYCPGPPDGKTVIAAFDFHPDGATFDPAIEIIVTYDPDALPEGTDASQLVIAFYNEETGAWEYLNGTVNPDTNTITFSVTHFTIFAVMAPGECAPEPAETPTPTPEPTATAGPTPTATVSPTPTIQPTPTVTIAPPVSGDDGSDNRELLVIIIAGCALLGALVGVIMIRMRKK